LELSAVREEALADLERQRERVQAEDFARLRAMLQLGFDPQVVSRHAVEELTREVEVAEASEAAAWLAEEGNQRLFALGHGATALCLQALSLEDLRALATPERDALVDAVARGTGAAGRSVRRGALLFAAMLVAGNDALPQSKRYNGEQLRLLIEAQRASLGALHCAYQDVATGDLAAAAGFFASPAGRWLRVSADRAIERALVRAAEGTARYIVDAFGDTPPAAKLRTAMR
jgi:hypothetical protein